MRNEGYLPVKVAVITQKGTKNGVVPSLIDKFCAFCPSFGDAGNTGLSLGTYLYSNDIEELKAKVEKQFIHIQLVFANTL